RGHRPDPASRMSAPKGRGTAWTEERGTSDEGRRRVKAPRRLKESRARATKEGGASKRPGGSKKVELAAGRVTLHAPGIGRRVQHPAVPGDRGDPAQRPGWPHGD